MKCTFEWLKTFYPKFHRMEWVYTDFVLGVAIRVMYIFSVTEKVVCLWLKDARFLLDLFPIFYLVIEHV